MMITLVVKSLKIVLSHFMYTESTLWFSEVSAWNGLKALDNETQVSSTNN